MPVENWMQFGTFAEQEEFVYPAAETHEGVIVNGNMAAHNPSAMAGFLLKKIAPTTKFIIDPFTHAFQHSPSFITGTNKKIKSSIAKLAEQFSSPIIDHLGQRALQASDFEKADLAAYTKNVLEFQRCYLHKYMEKSDVAKYLDDDEIQREPYALIAPYFYLTDVNNEEWIPLTLELLHHAKNYANENSLKPKIFSNLVINKGLLFTDELFTLADKMIEANPDGFIVWVDEFNEKTASISELHACRKLYIKLRGNSEREVINLHGGYFSILNGAPAFGSALSGVCHGPEYGESRAVVPVGGGIPTSKYYVPDMHSREKYRDCVQWFNKAGWLSDSVQFHANVCSCQLCTKVISGDITNFIKFGGEGSIKTIRRGKSFVNLQFPTKDEKINCLRHYLNTKDTEHKKANTFSKMDLLADLNSSIEKLQPITGIEYLSHLVRWRKVLSEV
ncbi:hypothetical protein SAMN05216600_11812 [Pseudomonas cuatrocienegasensis]|uniref:Uncharacterized protein n=1 Tax=Pseudomonas cuatrocienegasensis TaxID=543360 RepID=A0ABY1BMR4_9PSED|nr:MULTISPECIES: hypothetical protein [Pseudomonas]OEC32727.1 hypothetical protein A7D25_22620 [Pseudomonas sp. 21C1]SER21467.1 hypothetical protein SAMN05216600_11812 [Pseudomonas cuatrocienegasensis]